MDDEQLVREALSAYLSRVGFEVIQAKDGAEGLALFSKYKPDVVIVDLRMPVMGGLEVLEHVSRSSPETPVIIISGAGMLHDAIEALRLGACDFITKPIQDMAILDHTIQKALERVSLIRENREYREYLEQEVDKQTTALRKELKERKTAQDDLAASMNSLRKMVDGTIHAFGRLSEGRDPYTAGHQRRVAKLAHQVARKLGIAEEECRGIHVAGLLHDIGKIHVPSEILNKPGSLTELEMGLIRTHPSGGYEILKTVAFPWPVAEVVLQHHERCDGSGYPEGRPDEEILSAARIIHVADTVEAMSSHRPYRPARGLEEAIAEIKQHRGGAYCSEVVDACLAVIQDTSFEFV